MAGRNQFGEVKEFYSTRSFFYELATDVTQDAEYEAENVLEDLGTHTNSKAPFIVIGSQSIYTTAEPHIDAMYLNSNLGKLSLSAVSDGERGKMARSTSFSGQVGFIRFWTKSFENSQWKEHIKNFKSLGVTDPLKNFNFNTEATGAFERLRMDVSTDQILTESNGNGDITLIDFSQATVSGTAYHNKYPWALNSGSSSDWLGSKNKTHYHWSGSGFEKSKQIIKPESYYYSFLSPHFDQSESGNKVRIRSYLNPDKVLESEYAQYAPVTELPRGEVPDDDPRLSIEFSCVQALDEDMLGILDSLSFFDNALGDPNLMFSSEYPSLEAVREVYFNRLTDTINFVRFFEFFKWFDTAFSALIEQMIPRKTIFYGVNFVVESHVFERHKVRHLESDIYLTESERELIRSEVVKTLEGELS